MRAILVLMAAALVGCQAKNGGSGLAAAGATAGGGADGALIQRAQVVAAENLELKKIIAQKDAEIADLKRQLDAAQQENQRIMEQHAEIYGGLMRHLLECGQKLEAYEKTETITDGATAPAPQPAVPASEKSPVADTQPAVPAENRPVKIDAALEELSKQLQKKD